MIGKLPTSLQIGNTQCKIRTDYRDILLILQACEDTELTNLEKNICVLKILYINPPNLDFSESYKKALWFISGGNDDELENMNVHKPRLYSWEQDEQMIFSAINKIAGKEIRNVEYMHWWTFLGLFNEIGEGMFSSVLNIRNKKSRHKKLEKYEQEFYKENKSIIDLKKKDNIRTSDEMKAINNLLKL